MFEPGDIVEYTLSPGLAVVVCPALQGRGVGIDWLLLPPRQGKYCKWSYKAEPHHTDSDFWVEFKYLTKIGHVDSENGLDNFRAER